MAATNDDQNQSLNLDVRLALNDAYAFVVGQESIDTFAALTPEELFDQEIQRISGADTPSRPNELHRVDRFENNLTQAIAKIKALPDNAFVLPDETTDVNTSPEPPPDNGAA